MVSDSQHTSIGLFNLSNMWCKLHEVTVYQNKPIANCKLKMASSPKIVLFSSVFLGIDWAHNLWNFEDLIEKVNETIYLSHFYICDYLTQIHRTLFIYHIQFYQKVLVSTMCWGNNIFWSCRVFYLCLYLSITMLRIIQYVLQECSIQFYLHEGSSRMFFNNLARVLNFQHSLIYFFHLHTTIWQKYMIFFLSFIFSLCTTIWQKIRVLINLFSLFVHKHSTKFRDLKLLFNLLFS